MILGDRIKQRRIQMGLTQEELGNLLNVSKVSICGYENGTRTPTLRIFLDLVDCLGLTPDYLLGRDTKVIGENEEVYTSKKISNMDLKILRELKNKPYLYNKLYEEPVRMVELISRKIK